MTKPTYEELEASLARVRGLLQRLRDELSSYWSGCSKCASWLHKDYPGHFDGCDRCDTLRQAYRDSLTALATFPQSSSLVPQGAESADIGKLDAADKSGKVNRVDEKVDGEEVEVGRGAQQTKSSTSNESPSATQVVVEREFMSKVLFYLSPDDTPDEVIFKLQELGGGIGGSAETGGEKADV